MAGPESGDLETPFDVEWHGRSGISAIGNADRMRFATAVMTSAAIWRPDVILSAIVNFGALLSASARISGARTMLNVYARELWSDLSKSRRRHLARVDRIISDCHFTADYVVHEAMHPDRPTVIWDPVDTGQFCPAPEDEQVRRKYGIPARRDSVVILSLGRLSQSASHKGFDRLIPVYAAASRAVPNLRLVIAGRGDDRPRLEALAREHGVAEGVVFTGAIDETDLAAVYRCADIFSLVSDLGPGRGEGVPLTPLEAMACGTPIIVGGEDGSREAVFEGRNGFVISPRDPAAHRDAILMLAQDSNMRQSMALEARRLAVEHFGLERFRRQLGAAIQALPGRVK